MTRKLLMLAGMLGVCACSLFARPTQASQYPNCAHVYCQANPSALCACPPGTKAYGHIASCDSWGPDCNFL
jgi:hypothetical protein